MGLPREKQTSLLQQQSMVTGSCSQIQSLEMKSQRQFNHVAQRVGCPPRSQAQCFCEGRTPWSFGEQDSPDADTTSSSLGNPPPPEAPFPASFPSFQQLLSL